MQYACEQVNHGYNKGEQPIDPGVSKLPGFATVHAGLVIKEMSNCEIVTRNTKTGKCHRFCCQEAIQVYALFAFINLFGGDKCNK